MTQQPALWKALTGACTTGAVALGGAFLHLPDSFAYSHPRLAALVLPGGLSLAILALTFAVLAFVVDTARARWVVLPAGGYLALLLVAIPALLYRPLSVDRLTAYAFVQWNFKAERNFDEEPGLDWEEDWEEVWDDLQARAQASLETGNTDWLAGRAGKLFAHGHLLVGDKGQTCTLQEMAITYDLRDVISFQPRCSCDYKEGPH